MRKLLIALTVLAVLLAGTPALAAGKSGSAVQGTSTGSGILGPSTGDTIQGPCTGGGML
ncbi:MAG: hypothetical protein ACYC5Y_15150 [Symbiobacteriia bacterium]